MLVRSPGVAHDPRTPLTWDEPSPSRPAGGRACPNPRESDRHALSRQARQGHLPSVMVECASAAGLALERSLDLANDIEELELELELPRPRR